MSEALDTPEAKASIGAWLDRLFDSAAATEKTPRELLIETFGAESYVQKREELSTLLCTYLVKKASQAKLGESFARQLSHRTDEKLPFLRSVPNLEASLLEGSLVLVIDGADDGRVGWSKTVRFD